MLSWILSFPLRVTLLYALFATLWIIGSDLWVASRTDAPFQLEQTAKGLLFVGVTAVLLFLVLSREHVAQTRARVRLQQMAERLTMLHEIDRAVLAAEEAEQIGWSVLERLKHLVPAAIYGLAIFGESPHVAMTLTMASDPGVEPSQEMKNLAPVWLGTGIHPTKIGRQPIYIHDPAHLNIWQKVLTVSPPESVAGLVLLPLFTGERLIGMLVLGLAPGQTLSAEATEILQESTSGLALAIRHARLRQELWRSHQHLRQVSRQIVSAQEEERKRIARELHDEAGQALTALKIMLEALKADLPPDRPALQDTLQDIIGITSTTMDQIRALTQTLRPPVLDVIGLDRSLEGYCLEFSRRTRLPVTYEGAAVGQVPDAIGSTFYRLVQEALNNVLKHAQASAVQVQLRHEQGQLQLSVADNGKGFDPQQVWSEQHYYGGMGLPGIRERLELLGGQLELWSQPGQGTRLLATVPWEGETENDPDRDSG